MAGPIAPGDHDHRTTQGHDRHSDDQNFEQRGHTRGGAKRDDMVDPCICLVKPLTLSN